MKTAVLNPEFSRQLEQQEAAYWSQYFQNLPTSISDALGIRFRHIGTASAVMMKAVDILAFNRVVGLGMGEDATVSQIEETISWYRKAGIPRFFVPVSPYSQPPDLPERLGEKGFQLYNNWIKFYRKLQALPPVENGFRIEQIGESDAPQFADLIIQSFDWPEILKPVIAHPVGKKNWIHYLAYHQSQPVAAAALFIRDRLATLAFAATRPEYQGRGAQTALIHGRLRDAATAGCRWICTETAEETPQRPVASYRNMKRQGFQVAYLRPNYLYLNNPEVG